MSRTRDLRFRKSQTSTENKVDQQTHSADSGKIQQNPPPPTTKEGGRAMAAAASNERPGSHTSATVCAGKTARLHTTPVLQQIGGAKGPDASVVKMTAGLIPGHRRPEVRCNLCTSTWLAISCHHSDKKSRRFRFRSRLPWWPMREPSSRRLKMW